MNQNYDNSQVKTIMLGCVEEKMEILVQKRKNMTVKASWNTATQRISP